ncbi:STAS domain-containing protein [Kitasatospora sp. NPDC059648]|uniref:STAS domain-containing protein n=1 Tax=Kitasatospora sp. NPDC059648 TaxID=3346894 RepID=UPI0036BACCF9
MPGPPLTVEPSVGWAWSSVVTPYRERAQRVCSEPDLRIEITRVGKAVVCSLAGDLHMDNEEHVREALSRALDQAAALLAVEMSAVTLLTSSGLNALLTARRRANADGVALVLVAPGPTVRRVLRITEADLVFPLSPSVEQAVRHQRPSPAV